jgi:hypothetical protein
VTLPITKEISWKILSMVCFEILNFLGEGIFCWYDGTRYVGEWVNGLMEGKGELVFKDK